MRRHAGAPSHRHEAFAGSAAPALPSCHQDRGVSCAL
jgi:hypothetical protein